MKLVLNWWENSIIMLIRIKFMKFFIFLSFCLIGVIPVYSQMELDRNDHYLMLQKNPGQGRNDSIGTHINLYGGYHLNSNVFTNDFLRGRFIDDNKKERQEKRLKDVNRVGMDVNMGLTGIIKGKKLNYVIGLNNRQMLTSKFSHDDFELMFRGNTQYVGKTAQLSPLKVTYFDYQSIYLGIQKKIEAKNLVIGAGLSLIRGGRFQNLNIKSGTLYTDTAGTYLDFTMDYNIAYTNKSKSALGPTNGLGAAINLSMSWRTEKNNQLNIEVRDLGFIRWNNLNSYSGNSTYRFEGYDVKNIFQLNDSVFTNMKADTLAKSLGMNKENKTINFLIPATFHVNYLYNYNTRLSFVGGIKYMINASYIPRIYVKTIYYVKKDLILIPMVAYGGFGRADLELGVAKSFKDKLIVSLNLFYVEYLLLPKKSSGNGFNVSLTKVF
jgi:hypothetical protein